MKIEGKTFSVEEGIDKILSVFGLICFSEHFDEKSFFVKTAKDGSLTTIIIEFDTEEEKKLFFSSYQQKENDFIEKKLKEEK